MEYSRKLPFKKELGTGNIGVDVGRLDIAGKLTDEPFGFEAVEPTRRLDDLTETFRERFSLVAPKIFESMAATRVLLHSVSAEDALVLLGHPFVEQCSSTF